MPGFDLTIQGVTFDTVRAALTDLYFRTKDMTQEQFIEASQYVTPMQHNYANPIKPGAQDTWIQYWINEDVRLTEDYSQNNQNVTLKTAHITVRFLGKRAEVWAKAFHHLTRRREWGMLLVSYCNARMLKYVAPITVSNVDYFGTANTTKAFTTSFRVEYDEVIDFTKGAGGGGRLEYINLAPGEIQEQ